MSYLIERDTARAERLAARLAKENAGEPWAHLLLASVYATAGRVADARREFEAVLRVDATNTEALINLARLDYREDGSVFAAVKLQELFGLAETPRLGPNRVPVTFELLSPAGRPVQVTSDLRSFWTRGYPEVRRELRARYPKHPWPDDPWTATPTHRTTRRR